MERKPSTEDVWRDWLTRRRSAARWERATLRLLPHDPRCKICNAPFAGVGGALMRLGGRRPWPKNPNVCTTCEKNLRRHPGGVESELTLLFADVRGSTTVAEQLTPSAFTAILNRFYAAAVGALLGVDAVIDKLVGDEVVALFLPYLGNHARVAVGASRELLRVTGHAGDSAPWLPIGIGVHTGVAYVGVVGTPDGVNDFTALGDPVNVAARLASRAGPGEILVSDATAATAGLDVAGAERRLLELKGRVEPVGVYVLGARTPVIEAAPSRR